MDTRSFASEDPRAFLAQFKSGAILDEVQRVPHLFSYLQEILDASTKKAQFILPGSNNFLLQESISQSLAGRIAYQFLLPFSFQEVLDISGENKELEQVLFEGGYPALYDQHIGAKTWLSNYIRTYIERDVRQIKNVSNLSAFERFVRLCAARTGQLLNLSNLAIESGVDGKTVAAWLSVLQSSFIVHLLKPHYENFNKRLVKMPKLYFYDTGLVCSLLGIGEPASLVYNSFRGALFENFIVSELLKKAFNEGESFQLYFWRDNGGHEIDVIIDTGRSLVPLEIKSGTTITSDYFKNLLYWNNLSGRSGGKIVYAGDVEQQRSNGIGVVPWTELPSVLG